MRSAVFRCSLSSGLARKRHTPANALLLQGIITLVLVTQALYARRVLIDGGVYNARLLDVLPALRDRRSCSACAMACPRRSARAYPVTPLIFCAACGCMLYSSINYVRFAAAFGTRCSPAFSSWRSASRSIWRRAQR
jgi:hypothetical protein